MATVEIYDPERSQHLGLGVIDLLSLSRPTHKVRFVRRGPDDVQLLVFLDEHREIPFIRIPLETLYKAVVRYEQQTLV